MNLPARNVLEGGSPDWDERRRLVAAIGTVLNQTVGAFEGTVSRVTELTVLSQKGAAGRDLVVALQEFDRLQQEFATLGHLLERLSGDASAPSSGAAALLSGVSIAGLKNRLAATIGDSAHEDLSERPGDLEF